MTCLLPSPKSLPLRQTTNPSATSATACLFASLLFHSQPRSHVFFFFSLFSCFCLCGKRPLMARHLFIGAALIRKIRGAREKDLQSSPGDPLCCWQKKERKKLREQLIRWWIINQEIRMSARAYIKKVRRRWVGNDSNWEYIRGLL